MKNIKISSKKARKINKKNKTLFFGAMLFIVCAVVLGVSIFKSYADTPATITKTSSEDFEDGAFTNTAISGTGDNASIILDRDNASADGMVQQNEISSETGLISYWKMDNNWDDSNGTNHGTRFGNGIPFGDPKYGSNSGFFDGISDEYDEYVDLGSNFNFETNDFSIETWFKLNSNAVNQNIFASSFDDGSGVFLAVNRNAQGVGEEGYITLTKSGITDQAIQVPGGFSVGQWYHLVTNVVYENNAPVRVDYYINGRLIGSYNDTNWYVPSVGTTRSISGARFSALQAFDGNIDELAIYDRPLTSVEIADHFSKKVYLQGEFEQIFNLHWNGGWGDGVTDDSEAISFVVSNASAGAKISFQARIAENEADFDENLAYEDILSNVVSAGTYVVTRGDLIDVDVFGAVDPVKHFVQIKSNMSSDVAQTTSPVIDEISLNYQKDDTVPEINASALTIKRATNPDPNDLQTVLQVNPNDVDVQNAPNGKLYITSTQNFERGGHPYFSWNNAVDSESGIKGYCLYVGSDPNGDPETILDQNGFSNMLKNNSPISVLDGAGNPSKCQFIVPVMEGEKTMFDSAYDVDNMHSYWEGNLYDRNCGDNGDETCTYYLNIKVIDNENNIVETSSQLEFFYDDTDPRKNIDFLSLPSNYVSSKAVTMTWPVSGDAAALDDEWFNTGIAGYQYKIGINGQWRGDHVTGTEDYLGIDLIPEKTGTYTFSTVDFADINNGVTMIYFRAFDRAGNYFPHDESGNSNGKISAALKYDPEAAAPPTNLTVSPQSSTENSYAFSWDPPTVLPEGVYASDVSYCYTVNTLPSEIACPESRDTAKGVYEVSADAFATQPGENTFYVVSRSQAGVIRYDDYISVKFNYDGKAPAFGITNNIDISDISIKNTKNWKLAVSWDKPEFEGAGVSAYKVLRSETKNNCAENITAFKEVGETSGTSYVDTGLTQKRYYYCVKACDNANNCGASSGTVSEFPTGKFTQPAKIVDGPEISEITTSKANISWSTERESDSKVAYGEKSEDYFNEEQSNSDQVTGHSIDLNNLSPGTTYYFKAKWTDEDGNTGISSEKSFKTEPAPTVKDVKVSNIGINNAIVKFTTEGASSVKIYYGKSTSFGATEVISTSSKESDYVSELNDLDEGTKYYYKINTFDFDEREYEGTTLDFVTLPQPKISNVRVQQVMDTAQPTVLVTWDSNTDISSIVRYYPSGNSADEHHEVKTELISGEHSMVLRGLFANTPYKLVASGIDKVGNEAVSEPIIFDTASDTRAPAISDLNIEGSNTSLVNNGTSEQNISQLVVSWNTDEPATSQVEFGEGAGTSYPQKTQEDSNLTYNHLVVISGLTPSKVYHLRAVTVDKADNRSESVDSVSITPKESESALNLVITSLQQVFGFLNGN